MMTKGTCHCHWSTLLDWMFFFSEDVFHHAVVFAFHAAIRNNDV